MIQILRMSNLYAPTLSVQQARTSTTGSSVSEMRMVSPMPSSRRTPRPQALLMMPWKAVPASQIEALAEAGCEIVRMAIPRRNCLDAFEAVCAASPLPVVADIHFDARR